MSVVIGPNSVTANLVFEFDITNKKSFVGGPATNYYYTAGSPNPWTVSGTNTDVTGTADQGPLTNSKTWKFEKSGTGSQWNGWEGAYGPFTGSAGDIWTTSFWYKTSAAAGIGSFNAGYFYVSDWSRAYSTTILYSNLNIVADGQWHYCSVTSQINENYTNAIIVDGPSWPYSTSAGILFINGLQWTKAAYAPPSYTYISGTLANTQSVIDLTNNNTWTVNNLNYAYDGSGFGFNGSNSWLESPTSSVFDSQAITMESWNNPTTTSQSGFLFEKGQVNTQYSNFYNSNDTFVFRTIGLSQWDLSFTASTYITAGQWNHIVCTYGSGIKTVYINGVQRYQTTGITGTLPTGQTNQYVGKYGSSGINYPFNGSIAISKVYNRALTAEEVLQNFNANRGRFGI